MKAAVMGGMRQAGLMVLMAALTPGLAAAEEAWIRIEAKRASAAEAAIAGWKDKFDDVVTFPLPNGMTGIALGPADAAAAAARMAQLKASGQIPTDSYLTAPGGTAPLTGALAAATGAAPQAAAAPAEAPGTHIQLQATPGRQSAASALARWRKTFPEAGLWRLPGGVFAVALAPQDADAATARLAALKAEGKIPQDAYLATSAQLGTVIDAPGAIDAQAPDQPGAEPAAGIPEPAAAEPAAPVADAPAAAGAPAAATTVPDDAAPAAPDAASTAGLAAQPAPAEPPAPAVMPPMEDVQRALRWAGFYDGAIDGKSGPGTRAAIEKEIAANSPGAEAAAAMTSLVQRREDWRREMDLQRLDDAATGLGLLVPLDKLAFDRVERGLSIYGPKNDSGAALILTRRPGGQQEMLDFAGLVTALGWVPTPQRIVGKAAITLDGANDQHHGHAEARVVDGQVEGWVLIWPQADAENARRLALEAAESLSLTAAPAADAPAADAAGAQPADDDAAGGASSVDAAPADMPAADAPEAGSADEGSAGTAADGAATADPQADPAPDAAADGQGETPAAN